jgi:hypothetical protein
MSKAPARVLLTIILLSPGPAHAQAPTGTIAGVVSDATGARVANARVTLVNQETGQTRTLSAAAEGSYSAAALPPGVYEVTADATGFKRLTRAAHVEAGTTTTVDLVVDLGEVTVTVTVPGVQPLMHYDDHQVSGVVTRAQIENLPLNGRNFLELSKLEPGVTHPVAANDNRVFVAPLGAGLQTIPRVGYTRMTVDGASITTPGTIGTIFQVSQEVVQEFQLSTVNFDPATSLTSNGAVNIVTRSGTNEPRGTGFWLYRDHHLAAYPGLQREPGEPDPFFARRQTGLSGGGPIRQNSAFFFGSYERTDQRGVFSVQPSAAEFAPLGGIFSSPYGDNQFNARVDARLSGSHQAFGRYTSDRNRTFAPAGPAGTLPSGWVRRTNLSDQSLVALTSVLSARLVNDIRFSFFSSDVFQRPASAADCGGCFGLDAPRVSIPDIGLTFGPAGTSGAEGRRYQLTEALVWARRSHRLRVGFDWEHTRHTGATTSPDVITLWSPGRTRQFDPTIPLPATFTTLDAILQLPLRTVSVSVGPGAVPQRDFRPHRAIDAYRVYASDTWRARADLTINGALAWSYEPNALNHDLTKPALLRPILGADRLRPPAARTRNFSPTLGFAWTAGRAGRTVVRGGAGRYFDPVGGTHPLNLANERRQLLPVGTTSISVSGDNLRCDGSTLAFPQPAAFTAAQLLRCLPEVRAALSRSLNPANRDFSVRNIDLTKQGANLYDPAFATPYAIHLNLGIQRELAPDLVVTADVVWKHFVHTFINGIDYNRWNSARGPVLPPCTAAERNDVRVVCSKGSLFFDTTIGRARYKGLLVRLEKRYARRTQFLISYALGSYVGTNGTGTGTNEAPGGRVFGFNNDNWFENYGPLPTDQRHVLNASGFVDLPWRLRMAINVSAYSRPPFSVYVAGVDFNGDGTRDDLLPGTRVNQFDRGLDRGDLARLVDAYNQRFAGRRTLGGQIAPPLTLPADYAFGDGFFTQDVRVTRTFGVGRGRFSGFIEVFNVFNVANLVGYSGNLAPPAGAFGQPNARFTQVFGSGGPRAFQAGIRASF